MSFVPGNPNPAMGKNLKEMIGASHPQRIAAAAALHNSGLMPKTMPSGIAPRHLDTGGLTSPTPINQTQGVPILNTPFVPTNQQQQHGGKGVPNAPQPMKANQQNPLQQYAQTKQLINAVNPISSKGGQGGTTSSANDVFDNFDPTDPFSPENDPDNYASGGDISGAESDPWWVKKEASESYHPSGLFSGSSGGRTDVLNRAVPAGGYVIPADVVSGLGEGNTMAGAAVIDKMFHSDPYGITSPGNRHGGRGIPSAPAAFKEANNSSSSFARGGSPKSVPIVAASGEYMLHPDDIVKKFGDLDRGHKILDKWVVSRRKEIAKTMLKLKGPKR